MNMRHIVSDKHFDERELLIRKNVIIRGFFVLLGLMVIDHVFKALSVHWAHGAWNNVVYIALAWTIIMMEFIVRGVYFGKHDTPKRRIVLTAASTVALGFNVVLNIVQFDFAEYGQMTLWGATFIAFVLLTFASASAVVRAAYDLRRSKQAME
jgi:hypothetical protein